MSQDLDLGALMVGLGADVNALRSDVSDAKSLLTDFTRDSKKLGQDVGQGFFNAVQQHWSGIVASIYAGQIALTKIMSIGKEFVNTFQREQRLLAFDNLAGSIGENSQKIIASLKLVSGNVISTEEAISVASRAMLLGLDPTTIVKLMEVARASTKATGQTIEAAFYDVTLGVARQSKMILDNLGIILDYDKHLKMMQSSLKKTEDQLSDTERRQAFLNATLEAGNAIIQRVGESSKTLSDSYQEQAAALKDNANSLKDSVFHGGEFNDILKGVNDTLKLFNWLITPAVNGLRQWITILNEFVYQPFVWGVDQMGKSLDKLLGYTEDVNKGLKETERLIKNAPRDISQLRFSFPDYTSGLPEATKKDMSPEESKKWMEEIAKLVDKTGENINKTALATIESDKKAKEESLKSAKEVLDTYAGMYDDLKFDTLKYYDFQKGILVSRRDEEIKITGDVVLAWEAYYARLRELDEERALRGNDVLAGVKVFYAEQTREGFTWAQGAHDMMETWKSDSVSNIAEFGTSVMENWGNLSSAWKNLMKDMLHTLISTLNKMLAEWAIKTAIMSLGSLFGGFGGGGSSASSLGGSSSSAGSWGIAAGSGNPSPFGLAPKGMTDYANLTADQKVNNEKIVVQQTNNMSFPMLDSSDAERVFKKNGHIIQKIVGDGVDKSSSYAKQLRGQN